MEDGRWSLAGLRVGGAGAIRADDGNSPLVHFFLPLSHYADIFGCNPNLYT